MTKQRSKLKSGNHNRAGSDHYVKEIIRQLNHITTVSGYGAAIIFDDWTQLVNASLEALPRHIEAIATTGHWAKDTPETAEVFARIRSRYENAYFILRTTAGLGPFWPYFCLVTGERRTGPMGL